MESLRAGTGALNLLNKQEAELVKLRDEQEALVVAELNRARSELETEGRLTQLGKLCATPFGVDIVGITEFVALIGALVGGTLPPPSSPLPCIQTRMMTLDPWVGREWRFCALFCSYSTLSCTFISRIIRFTSVRYDLSCVCS